MSSSSREKKSRTERVYDRYDNLHHHLASFLASKNNSWVLMRCLPG